MGERKIYFVDLVYYNCYRFYRRYEKGLNAFSAQCLTSVCLSLNLILAISIIEYFSEFKLFTNKWYTLLISLPVFILIIIRYNRIITLDEIEDTLYKKDETEFKKLNLIAEIYVVVSIFGTITLAIILGELNNPPPFWENWF